MQRVPKEVIDNMLSILFVDEDKKITDESSRLALSFAKSQAKAYQKTLYVGLFKEIRAYQKKLKKQSKQKKLLGD